MSLSKSSLKICVLKFISKSHDPFKIGTRRKVILDKVINRSSLVHGPITDDEKNVLNTRLQRMLNSLVKEGLIKKENKGHQKTFYLLEKGAFPEYLELLEEHYGKGLFDKEERYKKFRQSLISRSDYLKLPEYIDVVSLHDVLVLRRTVPIPYEEFRSKIMTVAIEVLEPQIKAQYELMKKEVSQVYDLIKTSASHRSSA